MDTGKFVTLIYYSNMDRRKRAALLVSLLAMSPLLPISCTESDSPDSADIGNENSQARPLDTLVIDPESNLATSDPILWAGTFSSSSQYFRGQLVWSPEEHAVLACTQAKCTSTGWQRLSAWLHAGLVDVEGIISPYAEEIETGGLAELSNDVWLYCGAATCENPSNGELTGWVPWRFLDSASLERSALELDLISLGISEYNSRDNQLILQRLIWECRNNDTRLILNIPAGEWAFDGPSYTLVNLEFRGTGSTTTTMKFNDEFLISNDVHMEKLTISPLYNSIWDTLLTILPNSSEVTFADCNITGTMSVSGNLRMESTTFKSAVIGDSSKVTLASSRSMGQYDTLFVQPYATLDASFSEFMNVHIAEFGSARFAQTYLLDIQNEGSATCILSWNLTRAWTASCE